MSVRYTNDLGITLISILNFHPYIDSIWCNAPKILCFIKCITIEFKLTAPLKTYCSLVHLIEWGNVLNVEHLQYEYSNVYFKLGILAYRRISAKFCDFGAIIINIPTYNGVIYKII